MGRRGAWIGGFLVTTVTSVVLLGGCGNDDEGSKVAGADIDAGTAACGENDVVGEDGACVATGWTDCGDGFAQGPTGCEEIVAPSCAERGMPILGSTTCKEVGVPTCADGFERDPSGFGCSPKVADATCTGATRATPGGCVAVGDCAGSFPPAAATLFVAPNATPDATHFASVAAAIAAAPAGATIAVAAGEYDGPLTITKPVNVVGVCAAKVTFRGSAEPTTGIDVEGVKASISGVTITGFRGALSVSGGATVDLVDSVVVANRHSGIRVTDAASQLTVTRSAVRDTVDDDGTTGSGVGVGASGAARLTLDQASVTGSREAAVDVRGSATATLVRATLGSTLGRADGSAGRGLNVVGGAKAAVDATWIVANIGDGVAVDFAKITLTKSVVSGVTGPQESPAAFHATGSATFEITDTTLADATGTDVTVSRSKGSIANSAFLGSARGGSGLLAVTGADVTLTGVAVDGPRGIGAGASGGKISATDVYIRGTRDNQDTSYGLVVTNAGTIDAHGVTVDATRGNAVVSLGKGASFVGERVFVRDTKYRTGSYGGVGVLAEESGTVDLRASVIADAETVGIVVRDGKATLDRVRVRGTRGLEDDISGFGLVATEGAIVDVARSSFVDNAIAAIVAGGEGTTLAATSVTVRSTRISAGAGRAVSVQLGATVTLSRSFVTDCAEAALVAAGGLGPATRFDVVDTIVDATRFRDDGTFGLGVAAEYAQLNLDGAVLRRNPGAGLVYANARGTVRRGALDHNAVGLQVQGRSVLQIGESDGDAPQDTVVVSSSTAFVGNETRIGSGEIPMPEPVLLPP